MSRNAVMRVLPLEQGMAKDVPRSILDLDQCNHQSAVRSLPHRKAQQIEGLYDYTEELVWPKLCAKSEWRVVYANKKAPKRDGISLEKGRGAVTSTGLVSFRT